MSKAESATISDTHHQSSAGRDESCPPKIFKKREFAMLKQLWMSGILAAFLVFGIKIGVGLGSQMNHPAVSRRKKWW